MSIPWEEHYVYKLRNIVKNQLPLIVPGVRAIIRDKEGKVLFIERRKRNVSNSNDWGMPAGAIEFGESIFDCMKREVKEETGLEVIQATLISIYTGPKGVSDKGQMFEFCFRVDEWTGVLLTETEESTDARFYSTTELPKASNEFWHNHHIEVFKDLNNFNGQVIL
jgi:ADP-ribose pyrophosphatase YjhB (NUDIX family)